MKPGWTATEVLEWLRNRVSNQWHISTFINGVYYWRPNSHRVCVGNWVKIFESDVAVHHIPYSHLIRALDKQTRRAAFEFLLVVHRLKRVHSTSPIAKLPKEIVRGQLPNFQGILGYILSSHLCASPTFIVGDNSFSVTHLLL